jgi:formate dehydrogenase subunit gamma
MAQMVERYRTPTRILHLIHSIAFVLLFFTGLVLFIPQLGFLAEDSWTRSIHRIAAAVFIIAPLIYIPLNFKSTMSGIKEAFTWRRADLGWLKAAPRYYFLTDEKAMPPQEHMNSGQKMWWLLVIVFGLLFIITGLIMWFAKETASVALLQWMVLIHDVAFIVTGVMFFIHIYMSIIHPLARPLKVGSWNAMLHGTVTAEYAKSHHAKWYDSIPEGSKEKS